MVKYAVLISAGRTDSEDVAFHSEYWYDTVFMYKTLIENGFSHENIFVLYGDGNDFNTIHDNYNTGILYPTIGQLTNYPNSRNDIRNIFQWLADGNAIENIPAITNDDFLFVWWMGHGTQTAGCDMQLVIENQDDSINDSDFANYVNVITNYMRRAFVFMTCFSGGMIDNLQRTDTIVLTAVDCDHESHTGWDDVKHSEFTYFVVNALREIEPDGTHVASDIDNNRLVSLGECFDYCFNNMFMDVPQISDDGNIAPCTFIKLPEPGKNVEIMSRDHENDNGLIPSNYQRWYNGPDLWVRNLPDGITTHQNPIYGQRNYIYTTIHNLGCGTATNISVEFSWCQQTAWANPNLWHSIGVLNIPTLTSLQRTTIVRSWSDLPVPGTYCLHTRLDCPQDPLNAQRAAYNDNNKVQINIDIVYATWGVKKKFLFFIENASSSPGTFDIEINSSNRLDKTKIQLAIPNDLNFKSFKKGKLTDRILHLNDFDITSEIAKIKDITLEENSNERKRVILTINTPKSRPNQQSEISIETKVNNEPVGGITFISKMVGFSEATQDFLLKKINLLKGIVHEFGITLPFDIFVDTRKLRRRSLPIDKMEFLILLAKINSAEENIISNNAINRMFDSNLDLTKLYKKSMSKIRGYIKKRESLKALEASDESTLFLSAIFADYLEDKMRKK
ncbi:MAG: C13 family peptidase [Candidatus Heimdallarchaeota archaeon]